MGWATAYIQELCDGNSVQFRPRGNSMEPKIKSGQLCTVHPVSDGKVYVGDIVLCRVGKSQYLHIVKAIRDGRYQIGNNKGHINGWIPLANIYGILTEIK